MGFIGHAGDESGPVPDAARGDPIPRAAGPPRCLLREESTPRPTKEAAGGGGSKCACDGRVRSAA